MNRSGMSYETLIKNMSERYTYYFWDTYLNMTSESCTNNWSSDSYCFLNTRRIWRNLDSIKKLRFFINWNVNYMSNKMSFYSNPNILFLLHLFFLKHMNIFLYICIKKILFRKGLLLLSELVGFFPPQGKTYSE